MAPLFRGTVKKQAGKMKRFGIEKKPEARGPGGPSTDCICPQCLLVFPHHPGIPCFQKNCPQCGSPLTRKFLRGD